MLNDLSRIKRFWKSENLNLSDSTSEGEVSDYEYFMTDTLRQIKRRLIGWVGASAVADAESATPQNPDRAEALRDAEFYLLNIECINKLASDASSGNITDFETPSGMSIAFDPMSEESRSIAIDTFLSKAERSVEDYRI